MNAFEIGKIYNRVVDIHERFGGQRQGGISTPSGQPYIFIFTGDVGVKYVIKMIFVLMEHFGIPVKDK